MWGWRCGEVIAVAGSKRRRAANFLLGDGVMEPLWDEAGRLNERMKISEH
jgi:hypothetical protein